MARNKWDYYKPGQHIESAHLTVITVLYRAATKDATKYRVKLDCCGDERKMTQARIDARTSSVCNVCKAIKDADPKKVAAMRRTYRKNRGLGQDPAPYGVTPPTWAPPAGITGRAPLR